MLYRKRIAAKITELEARVDALEEAVKKNSLDLAEMGKNVDGLWNLHKEKMVKPELEQKPKPKRRRAKKNGKESPVSAE